MDEPDAPPTDPAAVEKRPIGRPKGSKGKAARYLTVGVGETDHGLIEFIAETLGTSSKAEAVRTSIRAYAMHLESVTRRNRT